MNGIVSFLEPLAIEAKLSGIFLGIFNICICDEVIMILQSFLEVRHGETFGMSEVYLVFRIVLPTRAILDMFELRLSPSHSFQ